MLKCGLLGERLKHSFSPEVHASLGDYGYSLFEVKKEDLEKFMRKADFDGINVTIPYKKAVIPYVDELSAAAKRTNSVNTVVKRADGSLFGDNTDYSGFIALLEYERIELSGKKTLILGSGGSSAAVFAAVEDLGGKAVVISRRGENNYDNINKHYDAEIIVNTTPVGMYPDNLKCPIELQGFKALETVIDVIYNPLQTALIIKAREMGVKTAGGLYMLVAQAAASSRLFTGKEITAEETERVYKAIESRTKNVVLIGMAGCGKSAIAKALGENLNRPVIDTDSVIEEKANMSIGEFFSRFGEEEFRKTEQRVTEEAGKKTGVIIATGGGSVLSEKNCYSLCQNGTIIFIKRDINALSRENRPLSINGDLYKMYKEREPLYLKYADFVCENNSTIENAAKEIEELIK